MMHLFVDSNGRTSGPLTADEVLDQLRQGMLGPGDEVWLEGTPHSVPIERLLDGRDPTQVDGSIFDALHPVKRARRPAGPVFGSVFTIAEALALLPGIGVAGTSIGAGVVGLVCIVFYLWGTISMNASGDREIRFRDLRARVVQYVDSHPEAGVLSLEALQHSGALTPDDVKLLEKLGAEYQPVGAATPDDGLLFTRTRSNITWRYYKGGGDDVTMWWTSPDQASQVIGMPQRPGAVPRRVRITTQPGGRVLAEYETTASSVWPRWRHDGRLVAINESGTRGGPQRFALWVVNPQQARRVDLPEELEPEGLLRPEDRARLSHTYSDQIEAVQWLADGTLRVASACSARVSRDPPGGDATIYARRTFVLSMDADGRVSIARREEPTYQVSEPRPLRAP